jgi:hypothetical protein
MGHETCLMHRRRLRDSFKEKEEKREGLEATFDLSNPFPFESQVTLATTFIPRICTMKQQFVYFVLWCFTLPL